MICPTNYHGQLLDLIYPDSRKHRVDEVKELFQSDRCLLPQKLHRVTMFLTFQCNLRCEYCNTISSQSDIALPGRGQVYDLPRFKQVIDRLASYDVQHLHLTGGEATLVKDLPQMVAYLSEKGISSSMTTNGTADKAFYRRLVENGLREIRISCDSHTPEDFDRLVHRTGAYERVVDSIRELVRMRDEQGHSIYIILNMCVGHQNMERLPQLIRRSFALGPNDIKLIGISHERADLAAFEHRQRIMASIEDMLAPYPNDAFPLLRLKVKTVFSPDTYGFKDITSKRVMKHCFIPLTERVFDGTYYYPCSTYLREGGKPLGRLDEDDFRAQQEKSLQFAKGQACPDDPICREFCIQCCKKFNLHANAVYNRQARDLDDCWAPITDKIEYVGEISHSDVLAVMREIRGQRQNLIEDIPYRPFLVIKPGGMPYKEKILEYLIAEGIDVKRHISVDNWNAVATRLYSVPLSEKKIYRGLLLERVLPDVESTSVGELLLLWGSHSITDLDAVKKRIRAKLPPRQCLVIHKEEILLTSLSYLHSPSGDNYNIEANLLLCGF